MSHPNPFQRTSGVDKPGIIGARWWNQAFDDGEFDDDGAPVKRRSFLGTLGWGAVFAAAGYSFFKTVGCFVDAVDNAATPDEEAKIESRALLEMQRDYGWNFGRTTETVSLDGGSTLMAYSPERLKTLRDDLAPKSPALAKYYLPALFESPTAVPRLTLADAEEPGAKPLALADALRPIRTPSMDKAYAWGLKLAEVLRQATKKITMVVDLSGPEAVAFAAGAADHFDPIFCFNNWPHPRGVVASHKTLAAALFHQPRFEKAKAARAESAPAMFVLDRSRLDAYVDVPDVFDNRYWVSLPESPEVFHSDALLYVVESTSHLPERADLKSSFYSRSNPDFVRAFATSSMRYVTDLLLDHGVTAFIGSSDALSSEANLFFSSYPWGKGQEVVNRAEERQFLADNRIASDFRVAPPTEPFKPAGSIGMVPVAVALGTGLILGHASSRNGSYNRAMGGSGG